MNDALDPLAIARQPTQRRARARFERILAEAEKLLTEAGLSGFSIPLLAERLGYPRGSIYAYFPTPYAILNELVARHLAALETLFDAQAQRLRSLGWREGIAAAIDIGVAYHNRHPAARILILGGAVTDASFRAQEQTHRRLGELARRVWGHEMDLPEREPEAATLAVDIGMACFRRSFYAHGRITPAYRNAAIAAMIGFLEPYAVPVRPRRATRRTNRRSPSQTEGEQT
ncbi:transcriptional regulator, TetR family [Fontimonas thermophila]|uniref:Transcriptional regulator, TetR family n=1 Tax=Fontimonas thermophila TaxID=1076937 RepID=A0A1I2JNR2_9GAMM|nr:TetR/AcrR family transcriptional regulator [Fontimonas thermophila]SFF55768.1 transcriptional regulator, TetR family [Fontimonas thermophila]